ncbi:MAG: hypothetical protein IIA70_03055 [Proteobacteria bacterium]|nr:hypothetical protein [Pseudomonadota bacterium]
MGKWRALAQRLKEPPDNSDNSDNSTDGNPIVTSVAIVTTLNSNKTERAAIHEYEGGLPREWAEAFANLQFMDRPDQYTTAEWEEVINDAGLFADKWAARARDLGWTIMDIFAVHKSGSRKRLDGEGVILSLRGNKVIAITADHIIIETSTGARQRVCKPTAGQDSLKNITALDAGGL